MNALLTTNQPLTMTSREIADLTMKRHGDVMRDIREMYKQLGESISALAYTDAQGKERRQYALDQDHTLLLVSGYNVKLRMKIIKRWKELEAQEQKPMTHLEVTAQTALALVEQEKTLKRHEQLISEQSAKLEQLEQSVAILPQQPANTESITYIRTRINKKYGLPAWVVNEALYSLPYAPRSAGQVKNTHEKASNQTYTVWNQSEVTKLFIRFVSECEQVTKTQAVHPSIDGRFKLVIAKA